MRRIGFAAWWLKRAPLFLSSAGQMSAATETKAAAAPPIVCMADAKAHEVPPSVVSLFPFSVSPSRAALLQELKKKIKHDLKPDEGPKKCPWVPGMSLDKSPHQHVPL